MMLALCPSCHRHVKPTEAACPFCGTTIRSPHAARGVVAAAVTIGLGIAAAGCTLPAPAYGPPPDTGVDTSQDDAAADAGPITDATDVPDVGPLPAYGPPPVDAGDVTDTGPAGAYGPPPDGI